MKRKEVFEYMKGLDDVSDFKGVKFAYAVLKNKKKLEEEVSILEEVIKPTDEYVEYENQRIQLCESNCEKDDKGQPIAEEGKYKILDMKTFDGQMDELREKYKETLNYRQEQVDQYNNLLEETIEFEAWKIKFDDIPSDMSATDLEKISFMVDLD